MITSAPLTTDQMASMSPASSGTLSSQPLTQDQLRAYSSQLGGKTSASSSPASSWDSFDQAMGNSSSAPANTETEGDLQRMGTNIKNDFTLKQGDIKQTEQDYADGKIGLAHAFVQQIGTVLGGAFSLPMDLLEPSIRNVTGSEGEQAASSAIGSGMEAVAKPLSDALAKPEVSTYQNAGALYQKAGDLYKQAHETDDPESQKRLTALAQEITKTADTIKGNADSIDNNYASAGRDVNAVNNIATLGLGEMNAETVGEGLENAMKPGENPIPPEPSAASPSVSATPELNKSSVMDKYNRAIKPSVSGKMNAGQIADANSRVISGLQAISDNKENLEFTDADGNVIKGDTPQTVGQLSEAIAQTKKSIFGQYDALAKEAGDKGISVDPVSVANELSPVINSKSLKLTNPGAIKYAQELQERLLNQGPLDAETAQEVIKNYNDELKAYYRNPTPGLASNVQIDAMIANKFRSMLDEGITNATGEQYQSLKNQYGALSSMEKDVAHRATVWGRQNPSGLVGNLTNIASGAELLRGLMTANPVDTAIGGTMKAIQLYNTYLNNPDRGIMRIFDEFDRAAPKAPTDGSPLGPGQSSAASPDDISPTGRTTVEGKSEVKSETSQNTTIAQNKSQSIPTNGGFAKVPFTGNLKQIRRNASDFLHSEAVKSSDPAVRNALTTLAGEIDKNEAPAIQDIIAHAREVIAKSS